jgi:hypothetical protein
MGDEAEGGALSVHEVQQVVEPDLHLGVRLPDAGAAPVDDVPRGGHGVVDVLTAHLLVVPVDLSRQVHPLKDLDGMWAGGHWALDAADSVPK